MNEVIYGRNPVLELLKSGDKTVNKILISKTAHGSAVQEIIKLAKLLRIPVHHSTPDRFDDERYKDINTQGVLAEISPQDYLSLHELMESVKDEPDPVLVVLDSIEDPHNLGAIARNAVAFGAKGLVIGKWRSSAVNDTVVKTSAGAINHIKVARVPNIAECITDLKENGYWVAGADQDGEDVRQVKLNFPLALVIGSEGDGIHKLVKDRCDLLVKIPQTNTISSLNASCASAVLLYHIFSAKK